MSSRTTSTATIENYLGTRHVGGHELAEQFRRHVEAYPVAERCHTTAKAVRRAGDLFEVVTEDGRTYRGRTVVYAAGKQYRTLGVPGEERFIGRGIAFCATCDAPLYHDKQVAVIGGGNSALTAVRDLHTFAREIHVVQNLPHLTADAVLVDEVKGMKNVKLHLGMEVREFLGRERLTGVRLSSGDGRTHYDLAVDGVFLEVGLVPNSEPVRALVTLNGAGEISQGWGRATPGDGDRTSLEQAALLRACVRERPALGGVLPLAHRLRTD